MSISGHRSPADEWLSLVDAAADRKVSVKTIRRRIADGDLPAYRFGRRLLLVRREDLDALAQRVPTVTRATPRRRDLEAGRRGATA
ncbi:helix-turn-helix domain-containing protein [Microbacterium sp. B2969]|uniref:Helix-turn-helix domain-containing protein n=1 Tax=Microbacterium alkaliflavum TaxID=3248839 RepID=A0ABW7QDM7_9MICO